MIFNLSEQPSIGNQFLKELRDKEIQKDRWRFRVNLERLGEILAYELSKQLNYESKQVETPLGMATVEVPAHRIVLATILRAGLPMHAGMLRMFDHADNAFISAYRIEHKSGSLEINVEYVSSPNLEGATLILCDPMLATGASMNLVIQALIETGNPSEIHAVSAIACRTGLEFVSRQHPRVNFWVGAIDEELTAKSYIVPGMGDAGDLSFGLKEPE